MRSMPSPPDQDRNLPIRGRIAIIGAGIIGSAVAAQLSLEGRRVVLFDPSPPGRGGAGYGNVGHLAAELVQPLPSPQLLAGFWKLLTVAGGPLEIPPWRLPLLAPWMLRFARAAFARARHTRILAPLVQPAVGAWEDFAREVDAPRGRLGQLLRPSGHFEVWMGRRASGAAAAQASAMAQLCVPAEPMPAPMLEAIRRRSRAPGAAGLFFPQSGQVTDPGAVLARLIACALERGAAFRGERVSAIFPEDAGVRVQAAREEFFDGVVVCAGAWSAPLLRPLGLFVPLESARGYHVEIPGGESLAPGPLVYADHHLVVTPMEGRIRASGFMEFRGADAAPRKRRYRQLDALVQRLGYPMPDPSRRWCGPRPVLPDYLPAIGRVARAPQVVYALGHQHLGLTLAPVTARLVADLVAGRTPRQDLHALDLARFGNG